MTHKNSKDLSFRKVEMPAAGGGKRLFFEESASISPPLSKRVRRFSSTDVDRLAKRFPLVDREHLEKALEECIGEVNLVINHLQSPGKCLGSDACISNLQVESNVSLDSQGMVAESSNGSIVHVNPSVPVNIPKYGNEWVELFVREMSSSSSIDDARTRISRILEAFGASIAARAGEETIQTFREEHVRLEQQLEATPRENQVLKRGVFLQHERQKQYEETDMELQRLKQLASHSQEKIRALEVNNYALTMHLKQYEQNRCISSHLHPDVF